MYTLTVVFNQQHGLILGQFDTKEQAESFARYVGCTYYTIEPDEVG